jgi:hypothetical protein
MLILNNQRLTNTRYAVLRQFIKKRRNHLFLNGFQNLGNIFGGCAKITKKFTPAEKIWMKDFLPDEIFS